MSRIRTIKPEFFADEKVAKLSRDTRLLFIGLWPVCCDDYGVSRAHPGFLKQIFPYDEDFGPRQIEKCIDELQDAGFVTRFEAEGEQYLFVHGWDRHQKVDHKAKYRNPEPPADLARTSRQSRETLALYHRPSTIDHRPSTTTTEQNKSCDLFNTKAIQTPADDKPPAIEKPPPVDKPPGEMLRAAWNDAIQGTPLPAWQETPPKRAKAVATAWKWKPDLAWWRSVFVTVAADPWARGEKPSPGHENWKATIDFVLNPDKATRFAEKAASVTPRRMRKIDNWGRPLPKPMTNDEFRAYQAEQKKLGVHV